MFDIMVSVYEIRTGIIIENLINEYGHIYPKKWIKIGERVQLH